MGVYKLDTFPLIGSLLASLVDEKIQDKSIPYLIIDSDEIVLYSFKQAKQNMIYIDTK